MLAASFPSHSRTGLVAVIALHLGVLWLLARPGVMAQPLPPAVLSVSLIRPAASQPEPEAPSLRPRPAEKRPLPAPQAEPVSIAATASTDSLPLPAPSAPAVAPVAASPAPPTPSAPRFDAAYLQNPAPAYPSLSRRLGEQGKVVLRVFVDANGRPSQIEVNSGSASPRLDQAAQDAVWRWQFIPARRGGEAVAAWVLVPIVFSVRG